MKKIIDKLIPILLITLICFNVIFPSIIHAVNTSAAITKDVAIENLKYRLGELKIKKELELEETDEDTKKIRLQEYFQDLKNKQVQATGDFYLETIEIANKIEPESDRADFLSNVPSYIEQFMNDSLGQNFISWDLVFNLFSITIDAVAGLFLYIPKLLFIIVPGAVIETVETMLASIGNENGIFKFLTIDNIFFNEIALTDINIFDFKTAGDSDISGNNVLLNIRNNVASWYYAIRNLSIALGLAVLIYIGIRMAISSIADDRAKYKKMFKDWLVSFALIFVLQYLMIFILQLNDGIIEVLARAKDAEEAQIGLQVPLVGETLQGKLLIESFHPLFMRGMASSILYFLLVVMTLLFLIVYIKRFITICILTMISPLITITYAIDKAGDGKAQALNKWLGEYAFTVLIQPFHCIIYMVFLQNIFSVINDTTGILQFGKIFVAIIMLGFIYKAEDIVKGIFGFKANNLSSAAILGGMALSKAASIGKLKSNMSGVKNAGAKANAIKDIKTPDSLPSQARNVNSGSNTPNVPVQGSTNSNAGNTNNESRGKKVAKAVGKAATLGIGNTKADQLARKVAGKVISGAIGYGLTGEYAGAIASDKAIRTIGKKKDEVILSSRVKQRREEALDAYQDYKESHGLTSEEMLEKSEELLNADIDSIEDAQDRNLAGWLQADKAAQEILGVDDANKEVMNHLYEYEG